MEWLYVTLDQITTRIGDGLHGTPKYDLSGEYFFINGNNLSGGKIIIKDDTKRISEDVYNKIKKELNNRTLLVAINGTLGNLALYQGEKIALGKSACYINLLEDVNKNFIRYVLEHNDFQQYARSFATGATIKNLGLKAVRDYSFKLPPLPTQKRIASILSAYDDLIEKNLKRITLLEEITQRTYEEWFVKFRVNGEQLAIDEATGLPAGWDNVRLNDIYNIKYGKNLPQTQIKESGEYTVYGASGKMGFYSNFNCKNKVVLITSRGNGSGDIHRTYENQTFVTNNSFVVSPEIGFEYLSVPYTLNFLKTINLKGYCSGSAQPQLTNASMDNILVQLPNKELIEDFNLIIVDTIEMADNLREQNQKLKQSRDILLPRLMSGTINVES